MVTDDHPGDGAFDVAIVGQGPVGQTLALLLAQQGHDVVILEKRPGPFPLPRAVNIVGEALRLLDGLGLSGRFPEFAVPATRDIHFVDAQGEVLLDLPVDLAQQQGWPANSSIHQPALEAVLRERGDHWRNLTILSGTEVVSLHESEGGVRLDTVGVDSGPRSVSARYVVGCDGANSFVRRACAVPVVDTGFTADWLVVDLLPAEERTWDTHLTQVCDPARPTTCIASGPRRRRFEFMRMPEEDVADLGAEESAWALLAPWGFTPDNAMVEKRSVYTFRARWAEVWSTGRIALAGDAAHQMPPMGGVGMVSGLRDVANLAWKLDLVLAGVADADLLETYGSERLAHVQHAIHNSVAFGKVLCVTDAEVAAARDAQFRALGPRAIPPLPPERLGEGAFPVGLQLEDPAVGTLGYQGRVRFTDGSVAQLDQATFGGFVVLVHGDRVSADEADRIAAALPPRLPARVVRVVGATAVPAAPTPGSRLLTVSDEDGTYLSQLVGAASVGQIHRPDFYLYGQAASLSELEELVLTLGASTRLREQPAVAVA